MTQRDVAHLCGIELRSCFSNTMLCFARVQVKVDLEAAGSVRQVKLLERYRTAGYCFAGLSAGCQVRDFAKKMAPRWTGPPRGFGWSKLFASASSSGLLQKVSRLKSVHASRAYGVGAVVKVKVHNFMVSIHRARRAYEQEEWIALRPLLSLPPCQLMKYCADI